MECNGLFRSGIHLSKGIRTIVRSNGRKVEKMRILIEEQGILVASSMIGIITVSVGVQLFTYLRPVIEVYTLSMM